MNVTAIAKATSILPTIRKPDLTCSTTGRLSRFMFHILSLAATQTIVGENPRYAHNRAVLSDIACSIRGDVKNIFLPTPEARIFSAASSPCHHRRRWSGVGPWGWFCVVPSEQVHLQFY